MRGFFMFLFVFTMFFSGGLIPTYLLVNSLGMVNTVWSLLIPGAMSVYNMIITRTFFQNTVPKELLEAAQIGWLFGRALFLQYPTAAVASGDLGNRAVLCGRPLEFLFQRADLCARRAPATVAADFASILLSTRVSLSEFEDPDLLAGKVGLEFLVKYALDCGEQRADYVPVSLCTKILRQGRHARLREGLTRRAHQKGGTTMYRGVAIWNYAGDAVENAQRFADAALTPSVGTRRYLWTAIQTMTARAWPNISSVRPVSHDAQPATQPPTTRKRSLPRARPGAFWPIGTTNTTCSHGMTFDFWHPHDDPAPPVPRMPRNIPRQGRVPGVRRYAA